MATSNLTIEQIEDQVGLPVVVLCAFDQKTQKMMQLNLRDLGIVAVANAVKWINDRAST